MNKLVISQAKKHKGVIVQDQIKTMLDDVAFKIGTLRKANELFSDRLAPNFNIFDYLRTDEMGLSRCIASLLNPTGTHGQGSLFLEDFLNRIDKDPLVNKLDNHWTGTATDGCQVSLEKQANGQRRIDIYFRFKNGEIIGIENKPWAWDQENQLKDYAEFIKKEANGKKWLLIYLSNNDPSNSEYSIDKKHRELLEESGSFIWLDYDGLIEWLEFCSQKSKALVVRIFIEELAKFIRMEINGELDMSEELEVKNIILKSDESIQSAFRISNAIKAAKEELLMKFRDDLKGKLNANGFELVWDDSMSKGWKSYAGFGVKLNTEQNLYLRFEFNSAGLHDLYWGIARKNDSIKKDAETWNKINLEMSNQFGSAGKTEWWPWWSWIDKHQEFGLEFRHWDKNEMPWIAINKNELAEKITNLAIDVHDALKENQNLLTNGVIE